MLVQMADELYPLLAANGKQAIVHASGDLAVYGDPDKLVRICNNILKNAVAYSENNSVIDITAGIERNMLFFANESNQEHEKKKEVTKSDANNKKFCEYLVCSDAKIAPPFKIIKA